MYGYLRGKARNNAQKLFEVNSEFTILLFFAYYCMYFLRIMKVVKILASRGRLQYVLMEDGSYRKRTDYDGVLRSVPMEELLSVGVKPVVVEGVSEGVNKEKTPKPVLKESGDSVVVVSSEEKIKKKRGRPRKPDSELGVRSLQYRRKELGLSRPVGRPLVVSD